MPEIPGWNAAAPEPTPPPKGYFPPVDLIAAWRRATTPAEAQAAPPPPQAPHPAAAAGSAAAAEPEPPAGHALPASNRLLIFLTVLGVAVVAGLGSTYYLFFRPTPAPAPQQPVVVPTMQPSPSYSPSPRPTRSPGTTFPAPAPPAPPPPPPAQPHTYTVQPGDTLITIGEKLGKDWRQIAAANPQVTDPNFITPGQILTIP